MILIQHGSNQHGHHWHLAVTLGESTKVIHPHGTLDTKAADFCMSLGARATQSHRSHNPRNADPVDQLTPQLNGARMALSGAVLRQGSSKIQIKFVSMFQVVPVLPALH